MIHPEIDSSNFPITMKLLGRYIARDQTGALGGSLPFQRKCHKPPTSGGSYLPVFPSFLRFPDACFRFVSLNASALYTLVLPTAAVHFSLSRFSLVRLFVRQRLFLELANISFFSHCLISRATEQMRIVAFRDLKLITFTSFSKNVSKGHWRERLLFQKNFLSQWFIS